MNGGYSRIARGPRKAALFGLLLAAVSASAQAVPQTRGETLSGQTANLPSDIHGKIGILVLGFSKQSSSQCHGWDDQIYRDYANDPRVVYYQMPVLQGVPKILRGTIIRSMSKDLPAPARARFLPLLENEQEWKTLVEFGPGDDAYVLLVDESGQIKWHTHGVVTTAAYAAFRSSLIALEK